MLDNVHLLLDAIDQGNFPSDFMEYLMGLLEQYEQLDYVATIDIVQEARILQTIPFSDSSLYFRLTSLFDDEATQLINEPVEYEFTIESQNRLLSLAGGHPFHLHAFCHLIYRRWEEARQHTTITLEDLEAVYPAALEITNHIVDGYWDYLRPNERLTLTAMVDLRERYNLAVIELSQIQTWLSQTEFPLTDVQLAARFTWFRILGYCPK